MIRTQTISYDARVKIFWMLVAVATVSIVLYIYAINATIRNTVARQNLQLAAADLSSEESSLEYAYINKKNEISIDVAYANGYKDISSPIYISRAKATSLTMR
jgi:hypothetical protein